MGCTCCKRSDVIEPQKVEANPDKEENILDSPFSKRIERERDGTIRTGQMPVIVTNAYDQVLLDNSYLDINESFLENRVKENPFMVPWKEEKVEASKYLQTDVKEIPPVKDKQPQYLVDLKNSQMDVHEVTSESSVTFRNKIFDESSRAICLPSGEIFLCGGKRPRSSYLLSISNGHIKKLDNLFEGRQNHSLAYGKDFVLASGGMGYEELSSCEIFLKEKWCATGTLNKSRSFHSSVFFENSFYVCGGMRENSIEKWTDGAWTFLPVSLQFAVSRASICQTTGVSFLVVGGEKAGTGYLTRVWEVDTKYLSVSSKADLSKIGVFTGPGAFFNDLCVFFLENTRYEYSVKKNNWEYR